jgi:mannosyltransferase OCH1-like enzyme
MNIPKIIHYCWFGKTPQPKMMQKCIASWKKYLPDYELILWNEDNFDVDSIQFTKEAYAEKKWAFITDYVRLYALQKYGGVQRMYYQDGLTSKEKEIKLSKL